VPSFPSLSSVPEEQGEQTNGSGSQVGKLVQLLHSLAGTESWSSLFPQRVHQDEKEILLNQNCGGGGEGRWPKQCEFFYSHVSKCKTDFKKNATGPGIVAHFYNPSYTYNPNPSYWGRGRGRRIKVRGQSQAKLVQDSI
jgi:hypothetical protein